MLVMTPFMIDHIGVDNYGLWILTLSLLAWFNIAELGFPAAVQRFITYSIEKNDHQAASAYYSTGVAIFSTLGLIAVAITITVSAFPSIFDLNSSQSSLFTFIIIILSVKVMADFLTNVVNGVLVGILRIDVDSYISTCNAIFKLLLIYIFLPRYGLIAAAACTVFADITTNLIKYMYMRKLYKELKFDLTSITKVFFDDLFKFSKHLILIGSASVVRRRSATLVVAKVISLEALAVYSICSRLVEHAQNLIGSFFHSFGPIFTQLEARQVDIEKSFNTVLSFGLFLSCSITLPIILLGNEFINLWLNGRFGSVTDIISLLALSLVFGSFVRTINQVLLAQANHKNLAWSNIFGAIISISFSIILGQLYGLRGVVLGTVIALFCSEIVLAIIIFKQHNKFSVNKVITKFILSMLLSTCAFLFSKYLERFELITSWTSIIVFAAIYSAISFWLCWMIFLDKPLRKKLSDMLKAKLQRT
jgi:O-antigen/teichoic acid export membrane protein